MGDGRKGGSNVSSDKDFDDLALSTFSGKAPTDNDEDDHAARHDYYKELVSKQKSGKPLTDSERSWMDQAVQAHHKVTAQRPLPGELSKGTVGGKPERIPFNMDDAAVEEFRKTSPYMSTPRTLSSVGNVNSVGNPGEYYDPAALSGTPQGMAIQNLESLQRPGVPRGFNTGFTKSLGQPQVQVPNGPFRDDQQPLPTPTQRPGQPVVIKVDPNDSVAMSERGEPLTIKGKPTGDESSPAGEYSRFTDRRPADVYMDDNDKFAQARRKGKTALEFHFGDHLKAVEDNDGKYPAGYFKGLDDAQKKAIKDGVVKLMAERKGTKA